MPKCCCYFRPSELTGDAAANFAILEKTGVPIVEVEAPDDSTRIARGATGLSTRCSAPAPAANRDRPFDAAIDWINAQPARKLAVDVPSGLDCDTGEPAVHTVRADHTCTFAAMKIGFTKPAARPFTGTVHVCDIGVPPRLIAEISRLFRSAYRAANNAGVLHGPFCYAWDSTETGGRSQAPNRLSHHAALRTDCCVA